MEDDLGRAGKEGSGVIISDFGLRIADLKRQDLGISDFGLRIDIEGDRRDHLLIGNWLLSVEHRTLMETSNAKSGRGNLSLPLFGLWSR
ncbi:MAG: hypothetical protein V1736_01065 [Pseudomonadota bacterium]